MSCLTRYLGKERRGAYAVFAAEIENPDTIELKDLYISSPVQVVPAHRGKVSTHRQCRLTRKRLYSVLGLVNAQTISLSRRRITCTGQTPD